MSTKWRRVLSSSDTLESMLRVWRPYDGLALQIPSGLSAGAVACLKAEHFDAYQTGHAFSYAKFTPDMFGAHSRSEHLAYVSGVVAWVHRADEHSIITLDVRTGKECSYCTEDRTLIRRFGISSSLIAALSFTGKCHIWVASTGERTCLQLPSARTGDIIVSGDTVAIVYGSRFPDQVIEIVIWALQTHKLMSFSVPLSPLEPDDSVYHVKSMLDAQRESIMIFRWVNQSYIRDIACESCIYFTRINFRGDIKAEGFAQQLPLLSYYSETSMTTRLVEFKGVATVWSFARELDNKTTHLMRVCYNFDQDKLEFNEHKIEQLHIEELRTSGYLFLNGLAYFEAVTRGTLITKLKMVDLRRSSCFTAKLDSLMRCPERLDGADSSLDPNADAILDIRLFGDEIFLVKVFKEGFCIWCFDKNVRMVNEDDNYRTSRRYLLEQNIRSKKDRDTC